MASTSFVVRFAAQIRDSILANRRARYQLQGEDLDTQDGSDAYNEADAYSLEREAIESRALQLTNEIFPTTCSADYVPRHADLIALPRKDAVAAQIPFTATGTAGSAWTTSDLVVAKDGTLYAPSAGGTIGGGGTASITLVARTAGSAGNKAAGTVLTWNSPPSGIASTGTVSGAATVTGSDLETIEQWAQRIVDWWRERPGSANRSDHATWPTEIASVQEAYVYPLYHGTVGPHTPGSVLVIPMGAPGSRVLGSGTIAEVAAYIKGTGDYALDGGKIPADTDPDDVTVQAPLQSTQAVTLQLVMSAGSGFPFTGTYTVAGGPPASTTTRVYLTTDPTTAGAGQVVVGDTVAVPVASARGGYEYRKVSGLNSAGVSPYYLDLESGLSATPTAAGTVRPAPAVAQSIVDALLAVFDRLGPGDVNTGTYPKSARWPAASTKGPYVLYRAALAAAAMGVPGFGVAGITGVVSANATTPAVDVTPAALTLIVPGTILLTE
jgi:uncharacterized phage protein gp47/JayE